MAGGRAGIAHLRGSRLLNSTTKPDRQELKLALASEARALGFDCIGITGPDATTEAGRHLHAFLDAGAHGDMDWLAANPGRRADPRLLWPDVRSIIMLGINYGPDEDPLAILEQRTAGAISVYARGDDYHDVIKKRLKALARWLVASSGGEVKVFVDTAAVMEKPIAEAAGLGWQGKHTNLVSREFGSWLFLGAIFTTLDLPRDKAGSDNCGSCRACLDICPDVGFPGTVQARCAPLHLLSHHREQGSDTARIPQSNGQPYLWMRRLPCRVPVEQVRANRARGQLAAREQLRAPDLAALSRLDDAAFRELFSKSPVKRIGRDRFMRNVLIAIGNSANNALALEAERLAGDERALVRALRFGLCRS